MNDVNKDNIIDFIDHTSDVLDNVSESDMDEQTTKQYLISNFLGEVLGWPISRLDGDYKVLSEYPIQIASGTKKVDYALLNKSEEPVCIVEAKRLSKSLSDEKKNQLKSYMKAEELIWGILSNGKEYCFYIRDDKDTIKEIEISHTTYSNLESVQELISLYSYANLESDESLEHRKEILQQHRRIKEFDTEETKNTLYDLLNPKNNLEKKTINEFITDYKDILENNKNILKPLDNDTEIESEQYNDSIIDKIESETPVKFRNEKIIFDDSVTSKYHLISVVELLFKIEYISDEDVPMHRGSKRYLINNEPVDTEGDDMYGPKELSNGYYLETNYSTKDLKNIIFELVSLKS